jgi:RimJ/RimL family protein N-acetyltransferase
VQNNNAQTTPIPRFARERALKVKPTLVGRSRAGRGKDKLNHKVFLEEHIILRPIRDDDINIMKEWLYKDYIHKWYKEPEEWLLEIQKRNGEYSFIHHYIVLSNNIHIGFCQFYSCADVYEEEYKSFPREGTYSIDYLIGDKEYLGKGIGRLIVKKLIEKIHAIPGARLIVVQPELENAASCNTLRANDFVFNEEKQVFYKSI